MAHHDLDAPEEVYPGGNWVPCTSNLVCEESSGSPLLDGIALQKYIHSSKRRKYRSYRSIGNLEGAEMSPYPPPPPPKSKTQIKEERIQERMEKLAKKIRNYRTVLHDMPNVTEYPEYTLFVGRLSYTTTLETLVNEFLHFGQIRSVRLVTNREGLSRGYAFIQFIDENGLKNALTSANKKVIDGQVVLLDTERGRLDKGWIPRRLGGGLGVKPKTSSRITRRERRKRKKKRAKARKAAVTDHLNTGANSQDTQNSQKQVAVNLSMQLEAASIAENASQGETIARIPVQPSGSHLQPTSDNPLQNHPIQQACSSGGGNVSHMMMHQANNHMNQPGHQLAPTFDHQSSTAVRPNYVQRIPAAGGVQFQQPYHYSQREPPRMSYPTYETARFQQPVYYNPVRVQAISNPPPVNYYNQPIVRITPPPVNYYNQPIVRITYQPYFNASYSSYQNPVHQFQNTAVRSQNYPSQSPNLLTLRPTNQNVSYPAHNWQPRSHIVSLPREYCQAPTIFYPVQQSVPQISSQSYENVNVQPENHHIQQSNSQAPCTAAEDHNIRVVRNEAPQTDPPHRPE